MNQIVDQAVAMLNDKMGGKGFDGVAKFVLTGEGSIIVDANGARAADDAADVTLTASADVFRDMIAGELNPTAAFMTGKLSVDGDMPLALKLGSILA